MLIKDASKLPKRIREVVIANQADPSERLVLAVRTGFRVNNDFPFAWLIVTDRQLLICSTHKRKGLHALYRLDQVDIRLRQSPRAVEVFPKKFEDGDYILSIADLDDSEADLLMTETQAAKNSLSS